MRAAHLVVVGVEASVPAVAHPLAPPRGHVAEAGLVDSQRSVYRHLIVCGHKVVRAVCAAAAALR